MRAGRCDAGVVRWRLTCRYLSSGAGAVTGLRADMDETAMARLPRRRAIAVCRRIPFRALPLSVCRGRGTERLHRSLCDEPTLGVPLPRPDPHLLVDPEGRVLGTRGPGSPGRGQRRPAGSGCPVAQPGKTSFSRQGRQTYRKRPARWLEPVRQQGAILPGRVAPRPADKLSGTRQGGAASSAEAVLGRVAVAAARAMDTMLLHRSASFLPGAPSPAFEAGCHPTAAVRPRWRP